ncbi:hypothetical protein [Gracilinema caldarium]|uniref:NGG1p interacting factor NIF3 n=1 Tax=Gracilinema caldarium (strain ATCC 51460 / DSM 7334 / H1) TaxID=744872 RepID=F8F368_GRAC1|nr:hypothetical protein [Gracilinema caldarium]AEJ20394.1 hypothetical protein Spica_2282 [Gracilinema caldarium DSM 7334]
MYVLTTFVPHEYTESLLQALFDVGAGDYGMYDHCAFVCRGEGRFRPKAEAQPFIGTTEQDQRVIEDRIELIVRDELIDAVLVALHQTHPYETPAIYLYKMDERALR